MTIKKKTELFILDFRISTLIYKYKNMEKIKNFNEFVNNKTLNEKTPTKEWDNMLLEMAQIGTFNKYTIIVWTNDSGNIPHFHIVDSSTRGEEFHTCIKIEKPEYFHHSGKEGVLNSKQRKSLVDFLKNTFDEDTSNWEYLIMTWNANNSNKKLSKKMPMPDYTNIK